MRTLAGWLLAVIVASLSLAKADDSAAIPVDAWEKFPAGVALAVTLVTHDDKGSVGYAIRVDIKNISNTYVSFHGPFGGNEECEVFYVDRSGEPVPLRDYNVDILQKNIQARKIEPEQTFTLIIKLNDKEVGAIRGCPVTCRPTMWSSVSKPLSIESKPKILIPAT
jgi:hypothetical protein